MENGTTPTGERPNAGLRDRLTRASELQALPPERLEPLLNLPDRLDAATARTSRMLTTQQQALTETERNLAHTTERLRRQADRVAWIQTGVILLALVAGMLGGTAAALLIAHWIR